MAPKELKNIGITQSGSSRREALVEVCDKGNEIRRVNGVEMTERQIVASLLERDPAVTKEFFFCQCFPLFDNIYNQYYTDCESVLEFMQEIYLYIILPNSTTGKSKLAEFGHRCSLTMWLKVVAEHYCHKLFARRIDFDEGYKDTESLERIGGTAEKEIMRLSMEEARKVVSQMPNQRYRRIIELRYLLDKTNEETAEALSMTMKNYYNKHRLAKAQLYVAMRKEGLL
ncbi:MAG: sigma-70 family RNA polymerase sigma factor [Bacteroidales bacterium]|nr:sigma-70 family RNA polymerase sigma factor [Bacteroidales bacterium]